MSLKRIYRILKWTLKKGELSINNICAILKLNRAVYRRDNKVALLLKTCSSDIKMEETGIIELCANLEVGIRDFGCSHYNSWVWVMDKGKIIVNNRTTLYEGAHIHIRKGGCLVLNGGYMNENSSIVCENYIEIGEDVAIAPDVLIRDCDSHIIEGKIASAPIHIGSHVWIGSKVIILKGVTIGDGSVIGAGSVVTNDIPPHCLAVGNPARVIRENIKWKK